MTNRMHLDGWIVLPGIVQHLANHGRQTVDGEAGTAIQFALALHSLRPLFAQAGKLHIIHPRFAVVGFSFFR